jgi:hypothetical protein
MGFPRRRATRHRGGDMPRLIADSYQWTIDSRQEEAHELATLTAGSAGRGNEVRDDA